MPECKPFWIIDDDEDFALSHCPGCGGFLPKDWPIHIQFNCKKCGKTLEALPNDDDDQDMEFSGKLCIVPEYAVQERASR